MSIERRKSMLDPSLLIDPEIVNSGVNEFHKIIRNAWEETLKGVLRQCLGREPELEDAKRLKIGTNPNWNYIILSFDGVSVGKIVYEFKGSTVTVTFIPNNPI